MGYLSSVLNKLGDDDTIIFVGTGVLIINRENKVLMGKRADNNQWCVPGGSLESTETLEECAVREVKEETGILVDPVNLNLNTVKHILEPVNKNGRNIQVVTVSYWTKIYDDIDFCIESREFSKYTWAAREELGLLGDIAPYTAIALERYFR